MTTYGPGRLSILERLAGSDAVVLIKGAVLARSEVDRLSENRREIGEFELTVADVLDGDVPETIHLRAARDADGPWPLPDKGKFVAFLQREGEAGGWVLVHDSAFRLRGSSFDFDEAIGCQSRVEPSERIPLADVRRLVDARREARATYDKALRDYEGELLEARSRRPSEMPESSELASWLDVEHGEGGRAGEPSGPVTDDVRPPKRRARRGRAGR